MQMVYNLPLKNTWEKRIDKSKMEIAAADGHFWGLYWFLWYDREYFIFHIIILQAIIGKRNDLF